jgi:diguanylate cyclase (GGDEF)-like protein/PAS domain S-box-containing protein
MDTHPNQSIAMIDDNNNQNDRNYLKSLVVLYVEDEDDVRTQMVSFLQRRVRNVYAAAHGLQGLDSFGQYDIDLVITDIRMPLMDGLAMAERIRAINPKIPIIITTAFEETRYFTRAIDLGVDKYIVKPINLDILSNTLLVVARQLRADAALREIEGRYRLLFKLSNISISVNDFTEASADKLGVLDLAGEIIDCNDAFLTLLGYDQRDNLTHKSFSELLMPSSTILLRRYVHEELLVKDISREFEVELRHYNGSKVPVWLQLVLRRDNLGKATEIWAVMRDQTEEIKAKESLLLAASVFERTSEAIMITDANNCIISVNKAFSRVAGYSQDEVLGQNPRILKSGKHNQEFYQLLWDNLLATGHWQGEIWNRRKDGAMYPEWLSISLVRNDAGQIINHISIFSDMTERKELSANLEFLAHYDSLTHVPNRIMLENLVRQSLAVASRNRTQLAFLFIDLDRFKNINDSLGHSVGDEVLKIVAIRLRQSLREMDIVARLGGDEFVVVLVNTKVVDDIIIVCKKLCDVLRQPISMGDYDLVVTPSIGISIFPKDGSNYETLLKNADTAMYKAKKCGRDNYVFYGQAMNDEVVKVLNMESALRNAIEKRNLNLIFNHNYRLIANS